MVGIAIQILAQSGMLKEDAIGIAKGNYEQNEDSGSCFWGS